MSRRAIHIIKKSTILGALIGWTAWQGFIRHSIRPQRLTTRQPDTTYSAMPTLLIPGWLGSGWSYNQLIDYWQTDDVAEKRLTVVVGVTGHIKVRGDWDNEAKNPLIQVIFANNIADFNVHTRDLIRVLTYLHTHYGITAYNAVAHSWGGNAMLNILFSDKVQQLPKLQKLVLLGVPVNEGIINQTLPFSSWPRIQTPQYRKLVANRHCLEHQPQVQITYFYGAVADARGDGETGFAEALALEPLVKDSPVTLTSVKCPGMTHTQLHRSLSMSQRIAKVLWQAGD
ncbi:hypothetical protein AYR62_01175 [Secundilactobacillus paracollinoides]|uniref:alpha/beta hydrolase n=1 Tax=Secundilactobacillus paracollinoides TaxID=240427 RepID=UPI00081A3CBB|nr:alpha/beta hydrolase [Secundilactobacillus paracollinoides]ANZ62848.1 hypothetical protein AYR62_01175 [Secundilactobacillus paracollinoides]